MKNIYDIIEQIKYKPTLFLGNDKLSSFSHFISGAYYALAINKTDSNPDFIQFHSWLRKRLNFDDKSLGFKDTLLEYCNGDEEKGLQLFFELIEEYKKQPNL